MSVAKALHVLAPEFFPLWDNAIAKAKPYKCYWYSPDKGALKYWQFMLKVKKIVEVLREQFEEVKSISKQPILKVIDEYNYSRFSKSKEKWLR